MIQTPLPVGVLRMWHGRLFKKSKHTMISLGILVLFVSIQTSPGKREAMAHYVSISGDHLRPGKRTSGKSKEKKSRVP
jgi:hypothetical protein